MIENNFYLKMKKILPSNDYDEFCKSLSKPPKRGLVFNNLKMSKQDFLDNFDYELEKLDYGECNYVLNSEEKMGSNIFHHTGAIYMQEPSAMIAGVLLPLKKGDCVLDACASPGGKTFQIAKRLNGVLISNEIDFERAKILNANIERLGLTNVMVTNYDVEGLEKAYPNKFDCVLVDAPCSGEGMFRKEDKAIARWSQEYVEICAKRQKEILQHLDTTLKQGGYLMYSTCTYSLEENEQVVTFLVDMGYKIVDLGKINGESVGVKINGYDTNLAKRFYPHKSCGEGQFVCLLQKCGENNNLPIYIRDSRYKIGATELKILTEFIKSNFNDKFYDYVKDNLYQKKDDFYFAVDKSLLVDDKKFLNYGVKLGTVVKGRFEPNHNLFTGFSDYFLRKVNLTKEQAYHYLRGNTVDVEIENGWCVVCYLNASIGGGKVVNNMLKNHYPKGLRLINTKK